MEPVRKTASPLASTACATRQGESCGWDVVCMILTSAWICSRLAWMRHCHIWTKNLKWRIGFILSSLFKLTATPWLPLCRTGLKIS